VANSIETDQMAAQDSQGPGQFGTRIEWRHYRGRHYRGRPGRL